MSVKIETKKEEKIIRKNKENSDDPIKNLLALEPFLRNYLEINNIKKMSIYYDKEMNTLHLKLNDNEFPDEIKFINDRLIAKYFHSKIIGITLLGK